MARFTQSGSGDGSGIPGPQGAAGADGVDGLDSLFLGTWNSVTEFLAAYQGGPVGLADGDWWAFVKDNTDPNKIYVVREDPNSATGWVIDDNEHFVLPQGPAGSDGADGADGADGSDGAPGADALWDYLGEYNGSTIYSAGAVVTYDGQLWYRNVYTSAGYAPGVGNTYWDLLAAKGADGADGNDGAPGTQGDPGSPGLVYLGNYVSGNGYIANLAVVKGSDNNLYIATSSGGLGDPVGNSAEWSIFLPKGVDGTDGTNGADGADGAQGDPGPQGDPGADGADANLDTGTTTINSYNPVWSGTGLAYTNTPTTGSYIKIGNLVTVQIDVLFTNVSNFGTGAYSLTLPFASKYHTDVYGGSIHKITNQGIDHYSLKGHLAPTSSTFTLWAIGSSASDQNFNNNTPVNIDTDDKFHMSFSYICE